MLRRLFGETRTRQNVWAAGLLVVMAMQLIYVSGATSITWDEGHHLFDGYTIWKQSDYRLNPEVPPLLKMVAAVPLLGRSLVVPANQGRSVPTEAFLDGREFVFRNGGDSVLFPARMVCMCFALLLGLLIYLAGREIFSPTAALFALAFFVFDPNFLAHGALVTTDVGTACLFLAAVYTWYRYCRKAGWRRLLLVGVVAGLSLAVKFTGVLALPMLLLISVAECVRIRDAKLFGKRCAALAGVALVAWIVLWSFYSFRYKASPQGKEVNPPLAEYLHSVPKQSDAKHLALLARTHVLPEAYIWGLANTKITEDADTSYFFGHVYRHGNWKYFPAAFLIKSTLPLLILLGVAVVAWFARWNKDDGGDRVQAAILLLLPMAVYLFVAMRSDMNIGLRHLLPIYPFLYLLAAGGAGMLLRRDARWGWAFGVLLVWQAATSLHAAPGYMAYANEAWGGPSQVHRYLSDANSDWGQQLKEAKRYLDERGIKACWFAYFPDGAVDPIDYGIPCKRLPTTDTLWWLNLPMDVPPVIDGPVLISDSDLEGIEFGQGALNPYDSFRGVKPTTVIQSGLFVYDGRFAVPLASALVHAQKAQNLLAAGQVEMALPHAELAVELASQAVSAQTALGDVLVKQGKKAEAHQHYAAALDAAKTIEPELQSGSVAGLEAKLAETKSE